MPNRPDYVAAWLGVTLAGGVVALLNTHLTGAALAHAIRIVAPGHLIVAAELVEEAVAALSLLTEPPRVWVDGDSRQPYPRIDRALAKLPGTPLPAGQRPKITIADQALYIYTSGTTGMPKAARVSHYRIMAWSSWFAGMIVIGPRDRMYNCLPLYHSIGGVAAVGAMLVGGGSVVVREKFSARHFWQEIVAWDCTLFQYIGELCRYLVNTDVSVHETRHRLRLACGNGLRADVWTAFKGRFAIPQILEFYAATEGNFSLYNVEGEPGAIGRVPAFLAHRFPAALVKLDLGAAEPVRDAAGYCIRCGPDEVGEAIGRIAGDAANRGAAFEGYSSVADGEKKILRDAFKAGDAWLRTGDLMRRDRRGFYYFVDRVGDTFRWKGENVATGEVAEALSACPGVREANVYGVLVPGTEGRAGMAALVVDERFDLVALRSQIEARLPEYARPLFLRLRREMEVTETFKLKKRQLAREGFDPGTVSDRLYFSDATLQAYVAIDTARYRLIIDGKVRL